MTATKSLTVRQFVFVTLASAATALFVVGAVGWVQGYRVYVVHTGSMEPSLVPGDVVVDGPAPHTVRPGQLVTVAMRSGPDAVVTHRVASVANGVITTKGDANRSADPWSLQISQIVGTEQAILPKVGYALVYLKQPAGLASVVTSLLGLLLLWQLFFPASGASPLRRGRHRAPAPPSVPAAERPPAERPQSPTSLLAGDLELFTVLSAPTR